MSAQEGRTSITIELPPPSQEPQHPLQQETAADVVRNSLNRRPNHPNTQNTHMRITPRQREACSAAGCPLLDIQLPTARGEHAAPSTQQAPRSLIPLLAARANENYLDVGSLLWGERPYIRALLRRATTIVIIRRVDNNPIIIMKNVNIDALRSPLTTRTKFIAELDHIKTLNIEIPLPEIQYSRYSGTHTALAALGLRSRFVRSTGDPSAPTPSDIITVEASGPIPLNARATCMVFPLTCIVLDTHSQSQATLLLKRGTTQAQTLELAIALQHTGYNVCHAGSAIRIHGPDPITNDTINTLARFSPHIYDVRPEGSIPREGSTTTEAPSEFQEGGDTRLLLKRGSALALVEEAVIEIARTLDATIGKWFDFAVILKFRTAEIANKYNGALINGGRYVLEAPTSPARPSG